MAVFGSQAVTHKDGTLILQGWDPHNEEEETPEYLTLSESTYRKCHVMTQWEGTISKSGRKVSPETNPTHPLTLDF